MVPALPGQVGQEDRGVRPPGPGRRAVQLLPARAERPPDPVQRHADVLGRGQPVGPAVDSPVQVDGAAGLNRIRIIRKWSIRIRGGEGWTWDDQLAAGAEREQAGWSRREARRLRDEAGGHKGGGRVGGAGRDREGGNVGPEAELLGGGGQQRAGDLGGRADGGQEVGAQPESLGHVRGPFLAILVEQQRARGIGGIGGGFAGRAHHGRAHHGRAHHGRAHHGRAHHGRAHPGQAVPQPVLGLEHPAGLPVGTGFVAGQPEQDRAGHAGRGGVAEPGEHLCWQPPVILRFGLRPAIEPGDRGAQNHGPFSAKKDAVHLPGDREGRDLSRRGTCRRPDRGARSLPPVLGVGLGPAGAGGAGLVAGRALAEHRPVGGA